MRTLITLTVSLIVAMPAWAVGADLKPSQIFAADSPSIVVVMAYGEDGKAIAQGSGVVIAKDTVISNCHVVEKADTASVLYKNKRFAAALRYEDVERDLCSFTVKALSAPPVRMGYTSQVQVGDAAYAIGAPEGLELTLSGGLISSLRKIPDGVVLQMTTPISPGSSGGGLFDSEGRLIGITSYYMKGGEQLNFALPVEWVRELPQRGKLASVPRLRNASTPGTTRGSELQEGMPTLDSQFDLWLFQADFLLCSTAQATQESKLTKGIRAFELGDYATAFVMLTRLAKEGNAVAQCKLGVMYDAGVGVQKDAVQAAVWYRKAATQGNAFAQYKLGGMYASGHGVELQDYALAAAWYRKAAAQGGVEAQDNLGLMYENGQGVPQDYVVAYAFLNLSASSESPDDNLATTERNKLMALMTPEQVTAGQALTRKMQRIGVIKALDEYLNGGAQR